MIPRLQKLILQTWKSMQSIETLNLAAGNDHRRKIVCYKWRSADDKIHGNHLTLDISAAKQSTEEGNAAIKSDREWTADSPSELKNQLRDGRQNFRRNVYQYKIEKYMLCSIPLKYIWHVVAKAHIFLCRFSKLRMMTGFIYYTWPPSFL